MNEQYSFLKLQECTDHLSDTVDSILSAWYQQVRYLCYSNVQMFSFYLSSLLSIHNLLPHRDAFNGFANRADPGQAALVKAV